jgi:hypothetical protein
VRKCGGGAIARSWQTYSLALGLDRHPGHSNYPEGKPGLVTRFAKRVTDLHAVLAYPDLVERKGLPRAEVGAELEAQLLSFMGEAEHIHFQLDGVIAKGRGRTLGPRRVQSIRDALARGALGTAIPRNVTNWELYQVWYNYRDKATFYWKSKAIDLTAVLGEPEERND